KIRRNSPPSAAQAGGRPSHRFLQHILLIESGGITTGNLWGEVSGAAKNGGAVQFLKGEPNLALHRSEDLRREINEGSNEDDQHAQGEQRAVVDQRQSADDGNIFAEAESDIRKRLRRRVTGQSRRGFCGMRDETGPAGDRKS